MGIVVADRAVDLAGEINGNDLPALAVQARTTLAISLPSVVGDAVCP